MLAKEPPPPPPPPRTTPLPRPPVPRPPLRPPPLLERDASEPLADIHRHYCEAEGTRRVSRSFVEAQDVVTGRVRASVINWLEGVHVRAAN